MKLIFFGTPPFAAAVLEHLLDKGEHEVVAVVSRPDAPAGRSLHLVPTAVKQTVLQRSPALPLFQPQKASEAAFIATLREHPADAYVVVAYGEIVKKALLDTPVKGCFNVHASLLPLYRGAAPIQRCLMDGVSETGITIMRMDVGLDSGDIVLQRRCQVPPTMTHGQLSSLLTQLSIASLDEALRLIASGEVVFTPQEHEKATLAPKVAKEELRLDLTLPAQVLYNKVRALSPAPGAWCYAEVKGEKKRLKIIESWFDESEHAPPGTVVGVRKEGIAIGTGKGLLLVSYLQLEGRPLLSFAEFLRGSTLILLS